MKLNWPSPASIPAISDHQREQYAKASTSRVGILIGTPGTGKSYTAANVIRSIIDAHGAWPIAVCAPTGKAAIRCTSALRGYGIATIEATTIHRLLGVQRSGRDGKGWGFTYNERNHLPHKFIIVDECFPAGTLVDTPSGTVPIEQVQPSDTILNAVGIDVVAGVKKREVKSAVKITAGKAQIVASESHRFFTERGWVVASEIRPGDSIIQTKEAVRLLRKSHCSQKGKSGSEKILQLLLLREMVDAATGACGKNSLRKGAKKGRRGSSTLAQIRTSKSECRTEANHGIESNATRELPEKGVSDSSANRTQAANSRREWTWANRARGGTAAGARSTLGVELADTARRSIPWIPNELQSRSCSPGTQDCNRTGRTVASCAEGQGGGQKKGKEAGRTRVDRVEILEPGHPELDQFRDADGKLYFYDIKASRHQSFSVEGCLVHNCSMLDTDLFASLLAAVHPGTHILFVGDPYQLAPVGHGAPLRDMIAAGIPCGELSEVRRNSGDCVRICREIKDGKPYVPSMIIPFADLYRLLSTINPASGENVIHIETRNAWESVEALKFINVRVPPGIDPVADCQVICAVNAKSELSRKSLNDHLQPLLNPVGKRIDGCPLAIGDKVICTQNTMLELVIEPKPGQPVRSPVNGSRVDIDEINAMLTAGEFTRPDPRDRAPGSENGEPEKTKEFVANGDVGRVTGFSENGKLMFVKLEMPTRLVKVPVGKKKKSDDGSDEDGSGGSVGDFDQFYAGTTHRMQGSQNRAIFQIIDDYPGANMVCSREHFYTGLSRMEVVVFTIGKIATANRHCRRVSLKDRKTFLREMLVQELRGVA